MEQERLWNVSSRFKGYGSNNSIEVKKLTVEQAVDYLKKEFNKLTRWGKKVKFHENGLFSLMEWELSSDNTLIYEIN
jgi:uncharacterized membrane-anchored protein